MSQNNKDKAIAVELTGVDKLEVSDKNGSLTLEANK